MTAPSIQFTHIEAQCDVVLVVRCKEGLEKVRVEITSAVKGGRAVEGITIHLEVADLYRESGFPLSCFLTVQ